MFPSAANTATTTVGVVAGGSHRLLMYPHYHPGSSPPPAAPGAAATTTTTRTTTTITTTTTFPSIPDYTTTTKNNDNKRQYYTLDNDNDNDSNEAKKQKTATAKKVNNEQWDAMFERLKCYKQLHGDCLVPKRYTVDPKLGTWVETQRVQYKRLQRTIEDGKEIIIPSKRLSQIRLDKLQSIQFAWSAKVIRNATTTATTTPTTEPLHLRNTTSTKYPTVKKQPSSKNPSLQKPTEDATVASTTSTVVDKGIAKSRSQDAQWEEMYNRLKQYKEKYGDCLVPRKYEQDSKLGAWVESQRVLWNRDFRNSSNSEQEQATATTTSDEQQQQLAMDTYCSSNEDGDKEVDSIGDSGPPQPPIAGGTVKRLTKERKEKLDQLGFVWSLRNKRIEDHWDQMFQQLLAYKQKHNDCLVPSRFEENLKLGKWVETQRYEYTKLQRAIEQYEKDYGEDGDDSATAGTSKPPRPTNPRLTDERLRRLESIGFEWKVKHKMKRYYDKQWNIMFERLLKFKEVNGHCMIPKRYVPDMKLGTWVHTQRIQYRKMMSGSIRKDANIAEAVGAAASGLTAEEEATYRLTEDRKKRLEEVGFIWSARESEKGNASTTGTTEQATATATTTTAAAATTTPSSSSSRIITRNSYDDQWDIMFQRLAEFKLKNGHCLVPKRCKEDPKLGTWVDTQRVQYKKMKKKLESQGLNTGLNTAVAYDSPNSGGEDEEDFSGPTTAATPGGAAATATSKSGPSLSQKPLVGRLTDERIRRLEALGFVWSLRDDWQKHYEELKEFKKEHGHCNVPARYAKNRRLGIWVSAQRQHFKIMTAQVLDPSKPRRAAPLTAERIELLDKLGFTWIIRSRDSGASLGAAVGVETFNSDYNNKTFETSNSIHGRVGRDDDALGTRVSDEMILQQVIEHAKI